MLNTNKGFFTLLGLLLALLIVMMLYHIVMRVYLMKPVVDQQTKEFFTEPNISTPSYKSTLDRTKKTIQDYNKAVLQREKEITK